MGVILRNSLIHENQTLLYTLLGIKINVVLGIYFMVQPGQGSIVLGGASSQKQQGQQKPRLFEIESLHSQTVLLNY